MAGEKAYDGFTKEERAAMKDRAAELKSSKRRSGAKKAEADEKDALAKIAEMPEADRVIAEKLHAIVEANAPELAAKTWYGMPAYAKDGKVVVFFKGKSKFKVRYAEVGFNEVAHLDDGDIWPTVFAVTDMNAAVEKKITGLVKQAVS